MLDSIVTVLGFDFGLRRIGVAVGQRITHSATPLGYLQTEQGAPPWEGLDRLVREWQPDALIVGLPLNMDGTEQSITKSAKKFIKLLTEHYKLPMYEVDERLSTVAARDRLFTEGGSKALRKKNVDSISAQILVENWLNNFNP